MLNIRMSRTPIEGQVYFRGSGIFKVGTYLYNWSTMGRHAGCGSTFVTFAFKYSTGAPSPEKGWGRPWPVVPHLLLNHHWDRLDCRH
jgi:hypothetical protein